MSTSDALQLISSMINTFDNSDQKSPNVDTNVKTVNPTSLDINTTIRYACNMGKRHVIQMPNGATNKGGTFITKGKIVDCSVLNARNRGVMFGSHGFQLINQNTKLSTNDFYMNPNDIITKVYYKEIEEKVKNFLGAEYVKCFHHQVRSKNKIKDAKSNVGDPAHAAHTDYASTNALNMYKLFKGATTKYNSGRYVILNTWRNISDTNPIYNDHLAMLDGRSVLAPDDYIIYDYISPENNKSESYYLDHNGAYRHKWYYYPKMIKNELLVFMQFDSDYRSKSRYAFHTSIHDPNSQSNNTLKNIQRESIETRLIAFFPDYQPNTIPNVVHSVTTGVSSDKLPDCAVEGIMGAIKVPTYWPDTAKDALKEQLYTKNIEDVIKWIVDGSAKGGYHGLGDATDKQKEIVINEILKIKDEFKKICLKNFPK